MHEVLLSSTAQSLPGGSPTDPLAVALILAGVAVLAIIFTLSARRKLIERTSTPSEARREYDRLRRQMAPAEDADVANARLHERAQQLAALLDNKAARLEQLIADADARIAELGCAAVRSAAQSSPQPGRPADSAAETAPAPTGKAVELKPEARQANRQSSTPPSPVVSSAPPPASAPGVMIDPTTHAVYQLADEGLSSVQIAQKMDEQIGKVELILALRPTRTT